MTTPLSPAEAMIYVMVTMSAADAKMPEKELQRIGALVKRLPVFKDFDSDDLLTVAQECGAILQDDNGLDNVLDLVAQSLTPGLCETAYVLATEIASADHRIEIEELRVLQIIAKRLHVAKLSVAAIEHATRARYRSA